MPESKTEWIAGSFPHPENAAALFERLMASNTLGEQFAAHAILLLASSLERVVAWLAHSSNTI